MLVGGGVEGEPEPKEELDGACTAELTYDSEDFSSTKPRVSRARTTWYLAFAGTRIKSE